MSFPVGMRHFHFDAAPNEASAATVSNDGTSSRGHFKSDYSFDISTLFIVRREPRIHVTLCTIKLRGLRTMELSLRRTSPYCILSFVANHLLSSCEPE